MSYTHEGVSCDNCMKSNFTGKRYKCLICYDFDLCSVCYDQSKALVSSNNSSSSSSSSIQDGGGGGRDPARNQTNKKNLSKSSKLRSIPSVPISDTFTSNASISNNIQINQNSHLNTHAMQCILTRNDHELFYGSAGSGVICDFTIGGKSGNEQASFTCPYCAKCGFSETTLCKHLSAQHSMSTTSNTTETTKNNYSSNNISQPITKKEVVCPICAVLPSSNGGDPNHLTDNLLQHINLEHVISNKNASKNLDDTLNDIGITTLNGTSTNTSSSANAAAAAAAALRFSRRLNYSQNSSRSSLTSQSGITIGNTSNRSNGGSINRFAFQFGQSSNGIGIGGLTGTNALSSFMRSTSGGSGLETLSSSLSNQIDPIAELLSQLTGVRRAASSTNSSNTQLQQLQAQLNRERENLQQQSSAAAIISGGQSGSSNRHHHLFSTSGLGSNLSKSQLLNSLASNKANNQNSNNQNAANQAVQTANNITNAFTNQILELPSNHLFTQASSTRDPRYLLSKYDFNDGENQTSNTNLNQINQSIFINDILISILTKQLSTELNLANNAETQSISNPTKSVYSKQEANTEEELLAEELLRATLLNSADSSLVCLKKNNPVNQDDGTLTTLAT